MGQIVQTYEAPTALNQERKETLLKLLQVEPDDFSGLVRATGWGEEHTRMALMQLTVDRKVQHKNSGGRRTYYVVASATEAAGVHK
ncbi:MAG: hypothetical protein CVU21_05430 [Betaproteobacteria bacterium HGW-Betaproteobacteria-15]|nr:MAG: hypothetical protein CVU21_05430 [Betaproteobacteria bacterium HGW-Betaproteobacteria-15]